ncbi:MAG TPA: hypothetical protein VND90_14790 [Terracidiphilus sp.]|nr:hypothetical protein [Terracidiphilus sp.]
MSTRMAIKVILFALLLTGTRAHLNAAPPAESNGDLRALITWGDMDNTPAKGAYVEAYGYVASAKSMHSFVFKMLEAGRYEVSLPRGLYDVFISDGNSLPTCRRMRVTSGEVKVWTVKLKNDMGNAHF